MQLLCIDHKTVWGGGQVALVNLLREWQATQAGIAPIVVCPPGAALAPRVRALSIACETFDLGAIEKTRGVTWNLAQRLAPTARLLETIGRFKTDRVLANGAFSFLAGVFAAKLARVPIIWVEHNTTLPNDTLVRRMIGWADAVVVVSEAIRAQFIRLAPDAQHKIVRVYNGVDTKKFCANRATRTAVLRELAWSENACIVGTVSRLAPEKGIAYFVEAANQLARVLPGARFIVVGDGPLRADLVALAETDFLRFVGLREDIPELLNAMDVFVLPSLAEAFGIAALEAMACALPVVASDVGGLRELVVENETGNLVPPGDAAAITRAVLSLCSDTSRRRTFGASGRARVLQHFTLERQAQAMQAILERGAGA